MFGKYVRRKCGVFMVIAEQLSLKEKLSILADAAKYDVACTSSGVDRKAKEGSLGNSVACGICHSFSADGRCISLLKILMTNECVFDCRYCINRSSNDVPRATFTPEEICELTIEFYRRNYIEGLFLSSGIIQSPDYTMELMCRTLQDLRRVHHFEGYIHCKAIPGASPELIEWAGWYADRMSVNLELPTAQGLQQLAPHKNRKTILTPMRQIQNGMDESRRLLGMKGGNRSAYWYTSRRMGRELPGTKSISHKPVLSGIQGTLPEEENLTFHERQVKIQRQAKVPHNNYPKMQEQFLTASQAEQDFQKIVADNPSGKTKLILPERVDTHRGFVPAGQSTQMIIGATSETDYEIISVAEALYQRFDLKRVFYSAFVNVNRDAHLPAVDGKPPLLREHRLYQADFLLRYYGFVAGELLSADRPNFNVFFDPKCNWALGHLEQFPVEISTADYSTLLRIPGIGVKSAGRIVRARRSGKLDFSDLKRMGVVLKRALYFITCNGKMMYNFLKVEEDYITRSMLGEEKKVVQGFSQEQITYRQLSLFDDFQLGNG